MSDAKLVVNDCAIRYVQLSEAALKISGIRPDGPDHARLLGAVKMSILQSIRGEQEMLLRRMEIGLQVT